MASRGGVAVDLPVRGDIDSVCLTVRVAPPSASRAFVSIAVPPAERALLLREDIDLFLAKGGSQDRRRRMQLLGLNLKENSKVAIYEFCSLKRTEAA